MDSIYQYLWHFPYISVIELDLSPYSGFTYKSNGVVVTQNDLDRGVSASDYVTRPNKKARIDKPSQFSGNSEGDIDYGCLFFTFLGFFYLVS